MIFCVDFVKYLRYVGVVCSCGCGL